MFHVRLAVVLAVCAAFVACSKSSPPAPKLESETESARDDSEDAGTLSSCQPLTCAAMNAQCGSQADGCGGTVDCGQCASGMRCLAYSGQCAPEQTCFHCNDTDGTCGVWPDNCGGTVDCGGCAQGFACNGTPNGYCYELCVPVTCAQLGSGACGEVDDGCGGKVQCGGCASGETCTSSGVCYSESGPGHSNIEWIRTISSPEWDELNAVTVDSQGDIWAVGYDSRGRDAGEEALTILQLNPAGQVKSTITHAEMGHWSWVTNDAIAVTPTGEIFLHYDVNCADHACRYAKWGNQSAGGSLLVKLAHDGSFLWLAERGDYADDLAIAPDGSAWTTNSFFMGGRVLTHDSSTGQQLGTYDGFNYGGLVVDGAGNLLHGTADNGLELLDSSGASIWKRQLTGQGQVRLDSVKIAPNGTIASAGQLYKTLTWGAQTVSAAGRLQQPILLSAQSDGTPRAITALPAAPKWKPIVATNDQSIAVIAENDWYSCSDGYVAKFDHELNPIWERRLSPDCSSDHQVAVHDVALLSDGSVIVVGSFIGATSVGTSAGSRDGFILKLAP